MSSRADGIVDARFENVGLSAAISFLPPADVVGAILPEQAVPAVRRSVIVDVAPVPLPHGADVSRESAGHCASAITCVDGGMAGLARAACRGSQLRTEDAYPP